MSTNVGNLNATLSLTAFEFNSGLKQSEEAAKEFATTTEVQSRRANNAVNSIGSGAKSNISQKLTQVGYMIQDFSSQVETRGIGPAIGAISNNLQMMGGPMVAIGAAVGGVILPKFLDWLNNTKEIAEAAKEAQAQFDRASQSARELATLEVKGGAGNERKALQDQIDINNKLKAQVAGDIFGVQKHADFTRKQFAEVADTFLPWLPMGKIGVDIGLVHEREQAMYAAETALKRHQDRMRDLVIEGATAQDRLNKLGPLSIAANKDSEIAWNKEAEDEHFAGLKRRDDLEKSLRQKSQESYGSEVKKAQARIDRERLEATKLRISDEAKAQMESMNKIDLARAAVQDAEKKASELGPAAGMSAGARRDTAAGVAAVNRAVAGTRSDQSLQKEQLKVAKDQLKKMEEIATGVNKPQVVYKMGGA